MSVGAGAARSGVSGSAGGGPGAGGNTRCPAHCPSAEDSLCAECLQDRHLRSPFRTLQFCAHVASQIEPEEGVINQSFVGKRMLTLLLFPLIQVGTGAGTRPREKSRKRIRRGARVKAP